MVSDALLPITIVVWTGVTVIAGVAAIVTGYVARAALAKARPADIPHVLAALVRMAEVFRGRSGGDR